jgi:hypothetical protein
VAAPDRLPVGTTRRTVAEVAIPRMGVTSTVGERSGASDHGIRCDPLDATAEMRSQPNRTVCVLLQYRSPLR